MTTSKKIEYDSRLLDIGIESNNQTSERTIVIRYDQVGKGKYLIELRIDAVSLIKKAIEELS